jgi:hypothetical protein
VAKIMPEVMSSSAVTFAHGSAIQAKPLPF